MVRTTLTRPRHRVVTATLMALLAVTAGAWSAPNATAADAPKTPTRATFGIQPAVARGPDQRPYLIYPVAPGAKVDDHVAVVNYSRQPLTLRVYATDAYNGADGSFSLLDRKQTPRDAGTWLRVQTPGNSQFVTVAPTSYRVLAVRLSVPPGADPGDHVAGIVVALSTATKNGKGTNVELDQRVGIRTFVRVAGPLRPALTIERVSRRYQQNLNPFGVGRSTISYTVRNTGNVSLGGGQQVDVKGLLGPTFNAAAMRDLPLLVPGGSVRVTASARHTWPLIWMTGRIRIAPKIVTGVSSGDVAGVSNVGHFWAVPWTLLGLVALLLLAAWARRRGRRQRDPEGVGLKHARKAQGAPVVAKQPGAQSAARMITPTTVVLALVVVFLSPTILARADSAVPYTDAVVTGSIGLCDVRGHNVMSGNVHDTPFVWLAVGSTAANLRYAAPVRTASLGAFQPRKGIDPGLWSGYLLGASSRYSNPQHPMSQATPISSSLQDFLGRYPPSWDGLVQLRLLLGGSNRPPQTGAYDATDIRITGDTWQVVRGGTGPCQAGTAVSNAVLLNLPGAKGTPKPGAIAGTPNVDTSSRPRAGAQSSARPDGGASSSPSATSLGASRTGTPTTAASPASARAKGTSLTPLLVGGGIAVLVAVALTLWAVRRRSDSSRVSRRR